MSVAHAGAPGSTRRLAPQRPVHGMGHRLLFAAIFVALGSACVTPRAMRNAAPLIAVKSDSCWKFWRGTPPLTLSSPARGDARARRRAPLRSDRFELLDLERLHLDASPALG